MTVTQSQLIATISEALTQLAQGEVDTEKLIKITSAHSLLVRLLKTLTEEEKQVNIEA